MEVTIKHERFFEKRTKRQQINLLSYYKRREKIFGTLNINYVKYIDILAVTGQHFH